MDQVKVRLSHTCNAPECPGIVGDVVLAPRKLADQMIAGRGAVKVHDSTPLTDRAISPPEPSSPVTRKQAVQTRPVPGSDGEADDTETAASDDVGTQPSDDAEPAAGGRSPKKSPRKKTPGKTAKK